MKIWNNMVMLLGFILLFVARATDHEDNALVAAGAIVFAAGSIGLSICYHKDGPSISRDDYKNRAKNRPSDV